MKRNCKKCINCDGERGFMVNCHYSHDETIDGVKYHVQTGQYCHMSKANKCEYYTEENYDRDEIFVL